MVVALSCSQTDDAARSRLAISTKLTARQAIAAVEQPCSKTAGAYKGL